MTMTATYTDATATVALACTAIPAGADTVLFERSADQVVWTQVRSGAAVPVAASAASLTDYEYVAGAANYYRASYVDAAAVTYRASSAVATLTTVGAAGSVTPGAFPAGSAVGDLVWAVGACQDSASTVTCATAGWTRVGTVGTNMAVYVADWAAGLALPAMSVSGTAAGQVLAAKLFGYINADVASFTTQANTSAQNVAFPALALPAAGDVGFIAAFKSAINTLLNPAATTNDTATGYTMAVYHSFTAGYASGTVTVTGGSAQTSRVLSAFMKPAAFMARDTATVTPAQSTVWLKSPLKPFLNRPVNVIGVDKITRASRSGVFNVISRSYPVAVTDLTGSRQTTLVVRTANRTAADDLGTILSAGDVWLISAPKGARTPTMYAVIGDTDMDYAAETSPVRRFSLPLTEVAQPDLALTYTLSTYATVLATYATYAALLAAKATYGDVLLLVGSPADVIVS